MNWLAFFALLEAALAGSGCNEVVQDLGPWIDSASVEKTEEGFSLSLVLVGGDVAASSTESVELLIGRQAEGHTRHFVLPKAAARKGGILEISAWAGWVFKPSRNSASAYVMAFEVAAFAFPIVKSVPQSRSQGTEEDLLGGVGDGSFSMQATLVEVNGNNHGPESLSCRGEGEHSTCRRTEKNLPATVSPSPVAGEGGHMMRGSGAGMQGAGMQGADHGPGFQMMVVAALFVCLSCLCGALFLHRFGIKPGARNVDSVPKVMGKMADGNLSTVQTMTRNRAFENDSDSDAPRVLSPKPQTL
ncbi:unnamed protein product [Symbiodinium sp. CCMP2456]|nr:unnamed protein product [Symbiodinium sp. CCMP2456]